MKKNKQVPMGQGDDQLGLEVKDIVTDFTGIATVRVRHINGCIQFWVQGKTNKEGVNNEAFDFQRLVVIGKGVQGKFAIKAEPPGSTGVGPSKRTLIKAK